MAAIRLTTTSTPPTRLARSSNSNDTQKSRLIEAGFFSLYIDKSVALL